MTAETPEVSTEAHQVTAYIGVYRIEGEDGIARFKCSEWVHASEDCVMRSIPIFEGSEFLGVFPIKIDPQIEGLGSGMQARLDWEATHKETVA